MLIAAAPGCGGGDDPAGTSGGTGGGGGIGDDGGLPCEPGAQDQDGDGVCLPDCSAVACERGSCAIDAGVAACECDPGFAGDACDALDAPAGSSVAFWVDAADPATVFADAGDLSSWSDKGAEGLSSLLAADDAAKPKLVEDALNGLPVVRFDGDGDYVSFSGFSGVTNETEYTIMMVVSASMSGMTFLEGTSAGGRLHAHTGEGALAFAHDPNVESSVSSAIGWTQDEAHLVTIQRTSSRMSVWIDGAHRVDAPTADGGALVEDLTLVLGLGSDADSDLEGDIAEVLIFDSAMDLAARRDVEAYLGAKWFGAAPTLDPTAIAAATVWLDASNGSSVTAVSDRVTAWTNLGNAGGHFGQGTFEEARPAPVPAALNGRAVVRFDGDDVMSMNELAWLGGSSYSVFAVLVPAPTGDTLTALHASAAGDLALELDILPTAGTAEFIHRWPAAAAGGDVITSGLGTPGEPILVRMRRSGPSVNFTAVGSATMTGTEASIGAATLDLLLGAESGLTPSTGFVGDIAELIVVNDVLANDEHQALETWLREK